jgi:hypothetical protein
MAMASNNNLGLGSRKVGAAKKVWRKNRTRRLERMLAYSSDRKAGERRRYK